MDFAGAAGRSRSQAERWLETAEKLLSARDLVGCKRFAERALETDPLLPGADELLAVADVLLAFQTTLPSGQPNPLAILQLPTGVNPDQAAVSRAFRRLALLLGPGNTHPGREMALRLVNEAYAVLSDPSRRTPPLASSNTPGTGNSSQPAAAAADPPEFWTVCPFCCYVHQYPRDLVGRALKCPNESCRRGFVAAEIPTAPTVVPGTEMYHCVWGFFPLGFPNAADLDGNGNPFYKVFPWNTAPSGEGAGGRSHGNRGGSYSGSARGGSSRGRVKKTTARKKVGAGLRRRSFGGGVENSIDSLGQEGWAGGEDGEDGREEVRGININEAAQATDGTGRVNVSGAGGVEDMGNFHIDVEPTEDILGNLHNLPFLRVDNLGRML
jgi:curved DNA-binding protein CbpA